MKTTHMIAVMGAICSLPVAQAASVVISFAPNAFFPGGVNEANDVPNGSIFANSNAGMNATIPSSISFGTTNGPGATGADFGPVTLTDVGSGTEQDFNIEITLSTNSTAAVAINRGGVGAVGVFGGSSPTLIDPGEQLTLSTITLIPVSGPSLFQFDGFSSVFFGNTNINAGDPTLNEQATANGDLFTATATAGGTAFSQELELSSPSTTLTLEGETGGVSLNGVTAEFSLVVPEPSSMSLLALGGLALVRRRRR